VVRAALPIVVALPPPPPIADNRGNSTTSHGRHLFSASRRHRAARAALFVAHIARSKRPREYRFVATLPKNNHDKVLKTALREQLRQEKDSQ
jgi:acyl-CoA synthetase (AMP-forming)/AMP-acid ligase II